MKKRQLRVLTLVLAALLIMLMTGGAMAAQPDPAAHNNGMPNSTTPGPNEVPLGTTPTTPGGGTGSSNLDLQMPTNSNSSMSGGGEMAMMNQMMGMDKMMMGNMAGTMGMDKMMMGNMNMNNMNNMNNGQMNMSGSGSADANSGVLTQLQASNAMIMQMLTTLSSQPNNANTQAQFQLLNQILANQTVLIQMLNNNSMNMSSSQNNSGKGSMGGMSMM